MTADELGTGTVWQRVIRSAGDCFFLTLASESPRCCYVIGVHAQTSNVSVGIIHSRAEAVWEP